MSNIDKRALRELATRATPGPWEEENGEVWIMRNGTANSILTSICGDDTSGQQDFDNARFISAANPATVLALLDELEARDKQNAELVAGRMNIQRTMGVYVHAYEEGKEQIAKDVEIKARLCRESNSLHDRLREAEKRIAELEAREVTLPVNITSANAPEVFEIAAEAERLGLRGTYASYAVGWNARGMADIEALREAGVKVAAAGKGEAS
jgi:hypothetical protein